MTARYTLTALALLPALVGCREPSDTTCPLDEPKSAAATAGGGGGGGSGAGGAPGAGAGGASCGTGAGGAGGSGGSGLICGLWSRDIQVGTAQDDQILGLAVGPDNHLYVTGYEHGVVGITNIEPAGDAQAVVMRYGPDGELVWKTPLDTPGTDTGEGIAVDPSTGIIFITGRTTGVMSGPKNNGQFDLFMAVLDGGGAPQSVFQGGTKRPEHPLKIALTEANDVLIAGFDDIYIPSNYVESQEDGFALSLNVDAANGYAVSQHWWLASNTPASDFNTALAAERDGSGALYIGGVSSSFPGGGTFVKKLDSSGAVLWTRSITTFSLDAVNAVALSPSGDLFAAGATFSTLGAQSFGQQDVFVMKLDKTTGATLWTAQVGSTESDWPTDLGFDSAGNIYVGGATPGSIAPGYINQGANDLFVLKLDGAGQLLSAWQSGTPAEDFGSSLAVDRCDSVFLAGFTAGALVAGKPSAGKRDMFLLNVIL